MIRNKELALSQKTARCAVLSCLHEERMHLLIDALLMWRIQFWMFYLVPQNEWDTRTKTQQNFELLRDAKPSSMPGINSTCALPADASGNECRTEGCGTQTRDQDMEWCFSCIKKRWPKPKNWPAACITLEWKDDTSWASPEGLSG